MPHKVSPMKWNATPVATLPGVKLGYEWEDGEGNVFAIVKFTTTVTAGHMCTHGNTSNQVGNDISEGAGAKAAAGIATVAVTVANYYGVIQKKGLNKTAMVNSATDTIDEGEHIFPDGDGTVTSADAAAEEYNACGTYIASAQVATSGAIPVSTVRLNCN